jgi:hypothetical protein
MVVLNAVRCNPWLRQSRYLAQRTPPMEAAAKRRAQAELGGGVGPRREVYGALAGRLTAKALRQMQHWTDIQVVSEPGGDFRSVRSTR